MDVRAQTSMVFHLDKCIGCHTCSVACKNIWTDRAGAEYMWWNNVETKPGTGYPSRWEDQKEYKGGWFVDKMNRLKLRCQGKFDALLKLFYNPNQPNLDDYYEPWTYKYGDLFTAKEGDDAQAIQSAIEALSQSSMKLGEAMYKAQAEEAAGGDTVDADAGPEAEDATVVDADFEEVDDKNKPA